MRTASVISSRAQCCRADQRNVSLILFSLFFLRSKRSWQSGIQPASAFFAGGSFECRLQSAPGPPQNTNQITNKGMEERKERSELSEDITFQASAKGSQNPQNGQPGGKRRKIHKSKAALKQKSNIATISKGLGEGHRRKAMR